ncbi:lysophospholipid acyltransferase family protein [Croceicoccus sp. F390]|uniref:Lysophospholipid acyltransferase family protein n=1 Tax=Croceicoccus esteveae TaxID=3075597 RepID=A0ABU2ZDU8_9SPHN|nr:lysophospholipid acyltransferase family protein [Croceicoccus sp. F390]MDT0574780.1 lysophospholipid acyltransferase family protein [Croceicoccus sp. F390]
MALVRIIMRLAAMAGWLAICLPMHIVCTVLARRLAISNLFISRLFLGGIARIAGVRIHTLGQPATGRRIILANHMSWIDIPVLARTCGAAFVAHEGLAAHPLLKILCEMNDTVFIARSRRSSVTQQIRQLRDAMRATETLVLFPEGTTGDGTAFLPLKSALLCAMDPPPAEVAVQPVLLDYGSDASAIAWTNGEPGPTNFLRLLARAKPIEVAVHFLAPLEPDKLQGRKAIADAVLARWQRRMHDVRAGSISAPDRLDAGA